ncbi:MAG: hypothetical protein HOQ44_00065 [Nocardia sp.]|nr:hypothetical protein [Nocardia sp.]
MWHWTTRTGEFPEAVAFTRVTEPEPTVTETEAETEEIEAGGNDAECGAPRTFGYDLAG